MNPLHYADRTDLATQLAAQLSALYDLPADYGIAFQNLVTDAVNGYPDTFLAAPANALDQTGMVPTDRVEAAARRQLALEESVLTQIPLSPKQANKIRAQIQVLVPVQKDAAVSSGK